MVSLQNKVIKRIGLLLPSANLVMEADFYRNLPENVILHTTRMFLPQTTVEGEEKMLDEYVLPAARNIENVKPDVVVFGCTSAGALRGKNYENNMITEIEGITNASVVSVMTAVKIELERASVKKLVIVTPYVDSVNDRISASMVEDGFEVLHIAGLGISESIQLGRVPGEKIVEFTLEALQGFSPDGVFISCTNFPAMGVLPILKTKLSIPVFSSNQTTFNIVMEKIKNSM